LNRRIPWNENEKPTNVVTKAKEDVMEKRDLCPGFLRQKPKKENSKVTAKNVREDIGKNGSMQEIR